MKHAFLPYDPGPLPTHPAPRGGESLKIQLDGWPPWKDEHFSIRNTRSPQFYAFTALRVAATQGMAGRAWFVGPIKAALYFSGPVGDRRKSIDWYAAGVEDTLDGGHGETFTYLPIVFEDDCQIVSWSIQFRPAARPRYRLHFQFLRSSDERRPNQPMQRTAARRGRR